MLADLRFALRQLRKNPGFTAVAVIALALGIGANTAIFSIINAIFLQPLPYSHPEQLVQLTSTDKAQKIERGGFSYPRYLAVHEGQRVFSDIAYTLQSPFTVTGLGDPQQVQGMMATANYLPLLGIQPLHGRGFSADEDRPGGPNVVILSHGYWVRQFGADPRAVGQSLVIDGKAHTIISVLPKSLSRFPFNQIDLWTPRPQDSPLLIPAQINNGGYFYNAFARLKAGVTLQQAREAVNVLAAGYASAHKTNVDANSHADVDLVLDGLVGGQRQNFGMLFTVVGCVLLIACANVANLLLARFASRRKEIAVRFALGATRRDVIRQFLTESVLLSMFGGALGLVLAHFSLKLVVALGRNFIPRVEEVSLDPAVLAFTLGASLLTGLIMGFVPAWQGARADMNEALKDASRGSTGDGRQNRFRNGLLVAEVAVSFVLLIAASLLISSFVRLQNVAPGFASKGILTGAIVLPPSQYPIWSNELVSFYKRLYDRLGSVPGVESVAFSDNPPLSGNNGPSVYAVVGRANPPLSEQPLALRHLISPNRFGLLRIPIKQGRDFNETDTPTSQAVVIINETMAKKLFPNENPIGQKLLSGMAQLTQEVVGVVGDTHTASLTTPADAEMYYPILQRPEPFTIVMVKTDLDPLSLTNSVRAALKDVDAGIPLTNPNTMDQIVAQSIVDRRLTMLLLAVFAGLALVLASIGVYSVMAYTVTQRTSEIGVRMALGAGPRDVLRLVVGQGMKLVSVGMLIGLLCALAVSRLVTALLFGVAPSDPLIYGGVIFLIGVVALVANLIPALRATRIDPMVALRTD
jgi:predicted permease